MVLFYNLYGFHKMTEQETDRDQDPVFSKSAYKCIYKLIEAR